MSTGNPLFKPLSVFLVGISLSIGWGIRGDFGHESGAWIPGALAAIAVCLLSGRDDWQRRVGYCALFGGLGWGFGGSISYMYTLAFASSGQWQTVWYGYFAMFFVGGLWAGTRRCRDGASAVRRSRPPHETVHSAGFRSHGDDRESLFVQSAFGSSSKSATPSPPTEPGAGIKARCTGLMPTGCRRLWSLAGVCLYDLWDRRFSGGFQLILLAGAGMLSGFLLQTALNLTGLGSVIAQRPGRPSGGSRSHQSRNP